MSTSVIGKLTHLLKSHPGSGSDTKLYISPVIEEIAMLESLYEDDVWIDGILEVNGSPVEVDKDLPHGCAYVDAPKMGTGSRGRTYELRMSNRLALHKYGPRRRRGA